MLDNHDCWIAEIERRKLADESQREGQIRIRSERNVLDAAKSTKVCQCSDLLSQSTIAVTTFALKSANEKNWRKCVGKGCTVWECPTHFDNIALHEAYSCKVLR